MSGAFSDTSTQLASLTVVMNEFKDPRLEALLTEFAKTRLGLERSRMTGEDLRSLMTGNGDEAAPERGYRRRSMRGLRK